MALTDSVRLMFSEITAQHRQFAQNIATFDADLINMDTGQDSFHTVENIRLFLKGPLKAHFECEERYLFPAALMISSDYITVRMILELYEEHWELQQSMTLLEEKFLRRAATGASPSQAELKHARSFLQCLQDHNRYEMDEFYTVFSDDEEFVEAVASCRERYVEEEET